MYSIFLSNEDQAIEFGGRGAIGFVVQNASVARASSVPSLVEAGK